MRRDEEAEEWKIDTLDEEGDSPSALASRFFNIAKMYLGYTHTEAGLRTLRQIDDEITDKSKIEREREERKQRESIFDLFGEGEVE